MKASTFAPLAVVGALALCCLGPLLAPAVVALGLSAWFAPAGFVWVPVLLLIAASIAYFVRRRSRQADCCAVEPTEMRAQESSPQ